MDFKCLPTLVAAGIRHTYDFDLDVHFELEMQLLVKNDVPFINVAAANDLWPERKGFSIENVF